jgi:EAL domain-containing protein (putative c-di-GMP-specific phosphodiesterase class I)
MTQGCQGCRNGEELPFRIQAAFQPILDLRSGMPFAYEALVRGPAGESAAWVLSHVDEANRYRFDQACRVVAIESAVAAGLLDTEARLSINFLPNAVYSPAACIQLTLNTARATGLPLDRLIFEFTENEQVDSAHIRQIVDAYRKFGFTTAIDDFGAGYAGLDRLANLSTDLIKLDMELVRGVDSDARKRAIVDTMLILADRLGIALIAEGVETEAELVTLARAGVRYVQGYLIARPEIGVLPAREGWSLMTARAARAA